MAFLRAARQGGLDLGKDVTLFDPVAALMARVANRHRAQLLAQCGARARLQDFLTPWVALLRELPGAGVRWSLDVDPVDY